MTINTTYRCDICKCIYDTTGKAIECENRHSLELDDMKIKYKSNRCFDSVFPKWVMIEFPNGNMKIYRAMGED